ncbi:hypothetical protein ACFL0W_02625 [Nanoarchaeota archaeon]
MRKHKAKKHLEQKAKKEKKKTPKEKLITWIIIIVMVFSVIGFMGTGLFEKGQFEYNGYEFFQISSGWSTEVNGKKIDLMYHPTQVDYLPLDNQITNLLKQNRVIALTFDPDEELISGISQTRLDFGLIGMNVLDKIIVDSVTNESEEYTLPVITCANATEYMPVIYMKKSEKTDAILNNSCIMLEFKTELELMQLSNKILYAMMDIIPSEQSVE